MTIQQCDEDKVKHTPTGGRIYEPVDRGLGDLYDSSRWRYTRATEPFFKATFKERLKSFIKFDLG